MSWTGRAYSDYEEISGTTIKILSFREIYNQKVQELFFMLEQKDDLNASETRNPAFMNGISGVAYALLKLYTEMK